MFHAQYTFKKSYSSLQEYFYTSRNILHQNIQKRNWIFSSKYSRIKIIFKSKYSL